MNINSVLKKYWGYKSFRTIQKKIIEDVLDKKDTLGIIATGGGKSICFQIPAIILEGVCLVITPLIALMEEQVNILNAKGIRILKLGATFPVDSNIIKKFSENLNEIFVVEEKRSFIEIRCIVAGENGNKNTLC